MCVFAECADHINVNVATIYSSAAPVLTMLTICDGVQDVVDERKRGVDAELTCSSPTNKPKEGGF